MNEQIRLEDVPVVSCQGLTKLYGDKAALSNVNLTIPRGRIVGILGPNGSGKTTFIKILAGVLKATSGQVCVNGYVPGAESKATVSYLSDRNSLNNSMTPMQAIEYYAEFFADFDRERAADMIRALDVDLGKKMKYLSKGMKEKVHLVMTMSRRAHLYLLDEPIAGVDPAARDYILTTILSNYNPQATVIISTHLIADIEKVLDDFIFIKNGQIIRYDNAEAARNAEGKSIDEIFREVFRC